MRVLVPYVKETRGTATDVALLLRQAGNEIELVDLDGMTTQEAEALIESSLTRVDSVASIRNSDTVSSAMDLAVAVARRRQVPQIMIVRSAAESGASVPQSRQARYQVHVEASEGARRAGIENAVQDLARSIERAAEHAVGPTRQRVGASERVRTTQKVQHVQRRRATTGDAVAAVLQGRAAGTLTIVNPARPAVLEGGAYGWLAARRVAVGVVRWSPLLLGVAALAIGALALRRWNPGAIDWILERLTFVKPGVALAPALHRGFEGTELLEGVCTAFAPPQAAAGTSFAAQVFLCADTERDRHILREMAVSRNPDAKEQDQAYFLPLPKRTKIWIRATSATLGVPSQPKSIIWMGRTEGRTFEVQVPANAKVGNHHLYFEVTPEGRENEKFVLQSMIGVKEDVKEIDSVNCINVASAYRYSSRFLSYVRIPMKTTG